MESIGVRFHMKNQVWIKTTFLSGKYHASMWQLEETSRNGRWQPGHAGRMVEQLLVGEDTESGRRRWKLREGKKQIEKEGEDGKKKVTKSTEKGDETSQRESVRDEAGSHRRRKKTNRRT